MAKKKPQEIPVTVLVKPRDIFKNELQERISIGEDLYSRVIQTDIQFSDLRKDFSDWNDYNNELIKRAFNKPDSEYYYEYSRINQMVGLYDTMRRDVRISDPMYKVNQVKEKINNCNIWLKRLVDKLHLIEGNSSMGSYQTKEKLFYNRGFIVHGHNEVRKFEVARFIENDLRIKVTILHEQANKGLTIIEKFENYSSVDFAVALWTADDIGKAKTQESLNDRARQNVIFETGFFIGKLGRQNVIVLYEEGVEIPSDYSGVIFILLTGNWKDSLRKEIDVFYQIGG